MNASPAPSTFNTSIANPATTARLHIIRDVAGKGHAPAPTSLADQRGLGLPSNILDCGERLDRTPQYAKLFLRADHQIAERKHGLQAFGNRGIGHETIFTQILGRQPPKDRAIVHVEYHPPAACFDAFRRADTGAIDGGRGKMRAIDQDRAR